MIARINLLIALVFTSCLSFGQVENEDLLNQIKTEYGEILPREKAPVLYKNLSSIFNDLAKAQEAISEGSAVSINHFYIVQSEELNAFVNSEKTDGIRIVRNHVFITTGLIRKMMNSAPANSAEGLYYIAGILAHELGHPIDTIYSHRGEISIANHYSHEGTQALEIRADIDGMRILRQAEYPVDSLYKGLNALFDLNNLHTENALQASASTHPQKDFRLTSARLYLTFDRLQYSSLTQPKKIDEADLVQIKKETDFLKLTKGKFPFKKPQTFKEAIQRIEILSAENNFNSEFSKLEFNRLILSADDFLLKWQNSNTELTSDDKMYFKRYLEALYEAKAALFSSNELKSHINNQVGQSGLDHMRAHDKNILSLKMFSSEIVDQFLKDKKEILAEEKNGFRNRMYSLINLAHPKLFYKHFTDAVAIELANTEGNDLLHKSLDAKDITYFKFILEAVRFNSNQFEQNPEKSSLFKGRNYTMTDHFLFPLFTHKVSQSQNLHENFILSFRQAQVYARSSKNRELQKEMQNNVEETKKFFESFWQRKAFYAVIETQLQGSMINWNLLFEVLQIDPKIGYQQIEQDVVNYKNGKLSLAAYEIPTFVELEKIFSKAIRTERITTTVNKWFKWDFKSVLNKSKNSIEKNQFRDIFEVKNQDRYQALFTERLKSRINSLKSVTDLMKLHSDIISQKELNSVVTASDKYFYFNTYLKSISDSSIEVDIKKQLIDFILFQKDSADLVNKKEVITNFLESFYGSNSKLPFLSQQNSVLTAIRYYNLYHQQDSISFFTELRRNIARLEIQDMDYFLSIDNASKIVMADISNRKLDHFTDLEKLIEFLIPLTRRQVVYDKSIENVNSPYYSSYSNTNSESSQTNSAKIQNIKSALILRMQALQLTEAQKYKIYLKLTASGPTKETDLIFQQIFKISPDLLTTESPEKISSLLNDKTKDRIESLLNEGRIRSDKLKLQLTVIVLEKKLVAMQARLPVDRESIYQLISNKLNKYVPNGSLEKDKFIEKIAWRLKLRGSELDGFIEDQKSQNWRKANPMIVRVGSLLSSQISKMSTETRLKTIEYLLDPVNNETILFQSIMADLVKMSYDEMVKSITKPISVEKQNELRNRAERIAEALRLQAEESIRDSSPFERIPLYEVVLTSGQNAIAQNKDWHLEIARKFLDYKKGSIEEVMLTSFFEVIPEHEKTVAISYLLANSRQGQGSIANLFEVFGTVGIKFGQLASIWELFGKEIAQETQHLKNSAAPMSLFEVISLAETRDPSIKNQIVDYEVILGSASVKTVVKVKLKNGRSVVLLLQRTGLKENIGMNLDIGKRFIESLKQKNVIQNSLFLQSMIEALEEQLHDEISMKTEADKFKKASEIIEKLNTDMKSELKGWSFKVPTRVEGMPLREDMAFYEMADGMTFDKLSQEKQKEFGPLIAKANLRFLFQYGWFDPDRHTGNFFISEKNKTIWFLDFGQFASFSKSKNPFKWDPRLTLAHFIMALDKMNAIEILHYANMMTSAENQISKRDEQIILTKLNQAIQLSQANQNENMKENMLQVIDILMNNGIKIDSKYLFGALKGLIILYGENYVSPEEFKKILTAQVTSLLAQKAPTVATEKLLMFKEKMTQPKTAVLKCRMLFN